MQGSQEAIACFNSARQESEAAELQFTLVGTEGDHYEAILQTLEDGKVHFFREFDQGWGQYRDCTTFRFSEILTPITEGCLFVDLP